MERTKNNTKSSTALNFSSPTKKSLSVKASSQSGIKIFLLLIIFLAASSLASAVYTCDYSTDSTSDTCIINSTMSINSSETFKGIWIGDNGTLTHVNNTVTQINSINITCTNLTIESGGKINVTGKGFIGGNSTSINGIGPGGGRGRRSRRRNISSS
ncbi:hypothetical protein JW756_04740 [Candidatus Woesearchaeota archaeon]|nr:hypothetical protein [Candidatus Woesearchaeota archaeon]